MKLKKIPRELLTLMRELTYWQMLSCKLPQPVQDIQEQCNKVGLLYENVLGLVLAYNRIVSGKIYLFYLSFTFTCIKIFF